MSILIWFIATIALGYGTIVSAGIAWGIMFLYFCNMVKGWVVTFWGSVFLGCGYLLIRLILNHPF